MEVYLGIDVGSVTTKLAVLNKSDELIASRYMPTVSEIEYQTGSFECKACPSLCEIVRLSADGQVLACWGDTVTCGKEASLTSRVS